MPYTLKKKKYSCTFIIEALVKLITFYRWETKAGTMKLLAQSGTLILIVDKLGLIPFSPTYEALPLS